MSLEIKIDKLTLAIEENTKALMLATTNQSDSEYKNLKEDKAKKTKEKVSKPVKSAKYKKKVEEDNDDDDDDDDDLDSMFGEDEEEAVTKADVVKALQDYAKGNKPRAAKAKALLGDFDAQNVTQLKEEDYADIIAAVKKLG